MRTLNQILNIATPETEIDRAIRMAYEAGKSDMRGSITQAIESAYNALPKHRYHRLIDDRILNVILAKGTNINPNRILRGFGDTGLGEAAEIKDLAFEI